MALVAVPFPAASAPTQRLDAFRFFIEGTGETLREGTTAADIGPAVVNVLEVVGERVQREAPNAPQSVKNEAALRYFGYLYDAGNYGTIRRDSIGSGALATDYVVNHQRAWINCGAKAILAPWKPLHAARVAHSTEADQ